MSEIRVDTISEKTSANGVAVDGVTLKDSKIGIGTTSPSTDLHIKSTADNAPHLLLENFQNADTDDAPVIELYLNDETTGGIGDNTDVGVIRFTGDEKDSGTKETYAEIRGVAHDPGSGSGNRGNLSFFVQSAGSLNETLTIDEDKVGIGTTSPDNVLHVEADKQNDTVVKLANSNDSQPFVAQFRFTGAATDNNTQYFLACVDTTTTRLVIRADGDVQNHDNSYGSTSDERIKQGIRDANSQWDDIKALKVRNYKKNDDVEQYGDKAWEQIGVIAQELEASGMDKLVKNEVLWDKDDPEVKNGTANEGDIKEYKGVKYSVLYMKAIKALQEAMSRIEALEAEVTELKG